MTAGRVEGHGAGRLHRDAGLVMSAVTMLQPWSFASNVLAAQALGEKGARERHDKKIAGTNRIETPEWKWV
jgi:hypothetical protein